MVRSAANIYAKVASRGGGGSICSCRRLGVFTLFAIAVVVLFGGGGDSDPPVNNNKAEGSAGLRGSDTAPVYQQYEDYPPVDDDYYDEDAKVDNSETFTDDLFKYEKKDAVEQSSTPVITPSGDDASTLEETISEAIMDIDEIEEEEIEANQNMLKAAMSKMNDMVKIGLGRLFGDSDDVTDEALEDIASEIAAKLEDEVQEELHQKSDALADNKADEIEDVVEEDEDVGIRTKNIKEDVKQVEQIAQGDLRDEIDEVADQVKGKMKDRAAKIEKEVIEKKLGKKVTIENGVVKKEKVTSKKKTTKKTTADGETSAKTSKAKKGSSSEEEDE